MGTDLRIGQGDIGKGRRADLDERFYQLGVVQPAGVFADVHQCFVAIHAPFEDQSALQLDEIHRQLQEARAQGNGLALEVVRIAAAVPVLLVMANQAGGVLHRFQRHQQRLAEFRVAAETIAVVVIEQVRGRAEQGVVPA